MLWKRRCVRHKLRAVNDRTFLKTAELFRTTGKAAGVLLCKPPNFASICRSVRIDCEKQSFFNKIFVRRKVLHRASEKAKKHPFRVLFLLWRKRRDSNSRTVARHRISSAARYDHFDTLPIRRILYNIRSGFASVLSVQEVVSATRALCAGGATLRRRGDALFCRGGTYG